MSNNNGVERGERVLPADLNAERALLGSLLIERDAIVSVDWLPSDYFYLEKHGWIYEACKALYNRKPSVPIDLSTVYDELRRNERADMVGGLAYLGELSADVPTAVHAEYYARIVERTAVLRRLIQAGGRVAALGYNERDELETTLDRAEQEILAVTMRQASKDPVPIRVVVDDYYGECFRDDDERFVPTPYVDLNRLLNGGLTAGEMVVLAARPGMGKTAFALNVALHAAKSGSGVLFVSLEMSSDRLLERLVGIKTGNDTRNVRGMVRSGKQEVLGALAQLHDLPIYIDYSPGAGLMDVRGKIRRQAARTEISLVVVDYLQLMAGETSDRVNEVSRISGGIKAIAGELRVPVLALAQLNRGLENRINPVPKLSDLRDSGAIEQDSDVVIFIHREEAYDKETDKKGIAELIVAKNRNGETGTAALGFDRRSVTFRCLASGKAVPGY